MNDSAAVGRSLRHDGDELFGVRQQDGDEEVVHVRHDEHLGELGAQLSLDPLGHVRDAHLVVTWAEECH